MNYIMKLHIIMNYINYILRLVTDAYEEANDSNSMMCRQPINLATTAGAVVN
jgi:hypothetical protein